MLSYVTTSVKRRPSRLLARPLWAAWRTIPGHAPRRSRNEHMVGAFSPWLQSGQSGITVISECAFSFDSRKSRRLRANPRRGIGFEEGGSCSPSPIGSMAIRRSGTVPGRRLGGRPAVFCDLRSQGRRRGRDSAPCHPVEVDERGDPIV